MDRKDLTDRLPTDRLPLDRVPGIGSESETEPPDTFDEPTGVSDASAAIEGSHTVTATEETRDEGESDGETIDDGEDEGTPSRREQARKALLGVSIGGAVLAVLAAVVRRLLGEDEPAETTEEDERVVDAEPEQEQREPAPDAEAVATVVGLAFQVLVRRLVGEDESET